MDLFVNKDIEFDNNQLAVMLALNYLQSDKHDVIYTDINQIGYTLTNRIIDSRDKDRTLFNNIKKGLSSLIADGFVKLKEQKNNTYVISWNVSSIKVDTDKEKFIAIELWELQTIFNSSPQPFNLLKFFICIVSTINNKTKEWHSSQDNMVESFGGGKSTVNDYLRQLEELKLLYVYRPNKRRSDGTFYNINNSYGRYKDKNEVISAANNYISTIECEDIKSKIDRRSIKLRYNAFVGGSKKYINDPLLVVQLHEECKKYNQSLKVNPIFDENFIPISGLDLSVFDAIDNNEFWGSGSPFGSNKDEFEILGDELFN